MKHTYDKQFWLSTYPEKKIPQLLTRTSFQRFSLSIVVRNTQMFEKQHRKTESGHFTTMSRFNTHCTRYFEEISNAPKHVTVEVWKKKRHVTVEGSKHCNPKGWSGRRSQWATVAGHERFFLPFLIRSRPFLDVRVPAHDRAMLPFPS